MRAPEGPRARLAATSAQHGMPCPAHRPRRPPCPVDWPTHPAEPAQKVNLTPFGCALPRLPAYALARALLAAANWGAA